MYNIANGAYILDENNKDTYLTDYTKKTYVDAKINDTTASDTTAYSSNKSRNTFGRFPDYSQKISVTTQQWTATEDVYIVYMTIQASTTDYQLYIDNTQVSSTDISGTTRITYFSGYVKKGQVVKRGSGTLNTNGCNIYKLN